MDLTSFLIGVLIGVSVVTLLWLWMDRERMER